MVYFHYTAETLHVLSFNQQLISLVKTKVKTIPYFNVIILKELNCIFSLKEIMVLSIYNANNDYN